jgi:hypothetical protein
MEDIITTTGFITNNITTTYYYKDDTLNILLPFIVGIFVAIILGWMVIRHKMGTNKGIYDGTTIYCCPDNCLTFFKLSKLRNRRYI